MAPSPITATASFRAAAGLEAALKRHKVGTWQLSLKVLTYRLAARPDRALATAADLIQLLQDAVGSRSSGSQGNGRHMIIWHEERLHARVDVQPHVRHKLLCDRLQNLCLWLTASSENMHHTDTCTLLW